MACAWPNWTRFITSLCSVVATTMPYAQISPIQLLRVFCNFLVSGTQLIRHVKVLRLDFYIV